MPLHVEVAHRGIRTHDLVIRLCHRLLSIDLGGTGCIVGRYPTFHFYLVRLSDRRIVPRLYELRLLLLDIRLAGLLGVGLRLRLELLI